MKSLHLRKYIWFFPALITALGFLVLAFTKMPGFTLMLLRMDTAKMILECGVIAVILLVGYLRLPSRKGRQLLTLGVVVLFSWLHQIFLPIVLAVAYLLSLAAVGYAITRLFSNKEVPGQLISAFLYGAMLEVLEVCLLSLAGIGSYAAIRIAWLVTLALAIAALIWKKANPRQALAEFVFTPEGRMTVVEALIAGGTVIFLLVQLGRANGGLDYDSLWYGLRPEYVLNTGSGIYEDLKQIGCVFLYGKGMEILMMPLSGLPSYGFLLCFNIVIGWGLLLVTGRIVRSFGSDKLASLSMLLIAAIPGIMNMTMSAKTDCITLLFQLILVFYAVQFLQTRNFYNVWPLLAACIFTYTLKVSSLYFSTALLVVFLIYFLIHCWRSPKPEGCQLRNLAVLPLSIAALILVSYRTVVMCGMAIISVGASLSAKMGFSYDALWQSEPVQAAAAAAASAPQQSLLQKIGDLAYHTFILPNTDSTVHVIIAWATPLFLALTVLVFGLLIARIFQKSRQKLGAAKRFLVVCFVVLLFFTILSLGILGQIDGNYYMLTYSLAVIAFLALVREDHIAPSRLAVCLFPLLVFCFLFTCSSNWAWTSGFTEMKLLNRGYYPHQAIFEAELEAECPEIASILEEAPTAKALTFGEQSFVNRVPCTAESYVTAEHDGNSRWFLDTAHFETYLELAERNYIFIQKDGVDTGEKMASILGDCFRRGTLTDPVIENGYLLAAVNKTGESVPDAEANYTAYLREVLGVASTLETCTATSGYYADGWVEPRSSFTIQSGSDGKITVKGTQCSYPLQGGETIRITVDGEEALVYELTGSSIEFTVDCAPNADVTIAMECSFSYAATAPDTRTISFILDALTAE